MSEERGTFHFNGINASTGEYLTDPLPFEELVERIKAIMLPPDEADHYDRIEQAQRRKARRTYTLEEGDPNNLSDAGWGLILSADLDERTTNAILEALNPLIERRKEQVGNEEFVRICSGKSQGQRTSLDETAHQFQGRFDHQPGNPVVPTKLPAYQLIVAPPTQIPYTFQYEMDTDFLVGRIHFDTIEEYHNYAQSVVEAETNVRLPREALFFGTANPDDGATALSAEILIDALVAGLADNKYNWKTRTTSREAATKDALRQVLGGAQTPAMLFTATHGAGFNMDDPLQMQHQGALVTQDWGGPYGPKLTPDHYFSADDLAPNAQLLGLVAMFFACYGAGTPQYDYFYKFFSKPRQAIAPNPFMARLPQQMLAHPNGGALAVVGHVERAWSYAIQWNRTSSQPTLFRAMLKDLFAGKTLGIAVDRINSKYTSLGSKVGEMLKELEYSLPDPAELVDYWTASNDARSYTITGDPAVRLAVADSDAEPQARPTVNIANISDSASTSNATPNTITAPPTPVPGQPVAYGDWNIFGRDKVKELSKELKEAMQKLSQKFAAMVDNVVTLEVETFVSEDVPQVQYDSETRKFTGNAQRRAYTCIEFDGDLKAAVPISAGELDEVLWQVHLSMVEQAQHNRAEMLRLLAEVLGLV